MLTKDKNDGSLLRELLSIWLDEAFTQHHIIKKPCYVEFEYLVYYPDKVTGSITDLDGIKVERFLLWYSVNEIRVDLPSSGNIYFQVGFINKKLDIKQFDTPRSCQDNELWRTISETGDFLV
ncbi:uncharacterized protein [Solanum tuberosum]|uniref:Uncharacterized protein n=1 Tax=Solanum tuberosum TaxID=4113 RepID=M1BVI1_SOLTU|nr:PREDICTED: uncharacterized protein LOC107062058 [Solanum tuberosum]